MVQAATVGLPNPDDEQSRTDPDESEEVQDQAAGEGDAAAGDSTEDTTQDQDASQEESVLDLSEDEIATLKRNPDAYLKEINKAATAKFQEIAGVRKSAERANEYSAFLDALEENPKAAVRALAHKFDVSLSDSGTEAASKSTSEEPDINSILSEALGPEYEDLAMRLAPAISGLVESMADKRLAPLRDELKEVVSSTAKRESDQALASFSKKYPEWKKHEKTMVTLSKRFPPGEDVSDDEYLESIYFLARRNESEGDAVRDAVTRIAKSAASSTKDSSTVSDNVVTRRPAKPPSFEEAYEAAKRGERLE